MIKYPPKHTREYMSFKHNATYEYDDSSKKKFFFSICLFIASFYFLLDVKGNRGQEVFVTYTHTNNF